MEANDQVNITAQGSSGVLYAQYSYKTKKAYAFDIMGTEVFIPFSQVIDSYGGNPPEFVIKRWLFDKIAKQIEGSVE
jgi:hypothetical protein